MLLRTRDSNCMWRSGDTSSCCILILYFIFFICYIINYDVPQTTCLILVGPSGIRKSNVINRITKVFDDNKFAHARAQYHSNAISFLHKYK